jgi:hypothetical protein
MLVTLQKDNFYISKYIAISFRCVDLFSLYLIVKKTKHGNPIKCGLNMIIFPSSSVKTGSDLISIQSYIVQ